METQRLTISTIALRYPKETGKEQTDKEREEREERRSNFFDV